MSEMFLLKDTLKAIVTIRKFENLSSKLQILFHKKNRKRVNTVWPVELRKFCIVSRNALTSAGVQVYLQPMLREARVLVQYRQLVLSWREKVNEICKPRNWSQNFKNILYIFGWFFKQIYGQSTFWNEESLINPGLLQFICCYLNEALQSFKTTSQTLSATL